MEFRKHFGYDVEAASNEAAIPGDQQGESLTVQSMAEDSDLNVLMERFGVTGRFPENPRVPSYGDFEGINDFQTALHALRDAEDAFMEYPASFRARFENNPQLFLEFCSNEGNVDEMEKLGLLKPEVVLERGKAREAAAQAKAAAEAAALKTAQAVPGKV